MDSMSKFKKEARKRRLCSSFAILWGQCKTKEDYVKLSLIPQSIPYVATSSYEGWGLSTDDIYNNFGHIINGKKTIKNIDGIENTKGALFLRYDNKNKKIRENIIHIMETLNSTFVVEKNQCPMIYVSNNSNIKIEANGFNTISLFVFDNCFVDVSNIASNTKILITKYSSNCTVVSNENNDNITYFNKPLNI